MYSVNQRALFLGATILFSLFLLVPTMFRSQLSGDESWTMSRPLSLGLDLSGGVHLVYDVVVDEAVKSHLRVVANNIRSVLRKQNIAVTSAKANEQSEVEVTLLNAAVAERAKSVINEEFRELELKSRTEEGERVKLVFGLPELLVKQKKNIAVEQALETIRARVDQFGVAEPLLQRQGETRILLQMPGVNDIEKVKSLVGKVARLEFRLVPVSGSGGVTFKNREGAPVRVSEEVAMTGDAVENAQISIEPGQVEVMLQLTKDGGRLFKQITGDNVGRQLAILLDDVVYSAPQIREPISGGRASISGGFSVDEAKQLAVVLRAGALPAPLVVAEERTVGPTLGAESIQKGLVGILVGFAAIALFMLWYYRMSGVIAVVTLGLNLLFLLAALALFGATLTLPGLAGLALTVGMAVDSNVIIFERIRDEVRSGAGKRAAVDAGFNKALSAIIDTNVTGLLTGVILYAFGTGPIRGFAVTLSIGVITTMFCAVFAARVGFDLLRVEGKDGLSI